MRERGTSGNNQESGMTSDRGRMRKGKWPETKGGLDFQNETWNSRDKNPRQDKTSPLCDTMLRLFFSVFGAPPIGLEYELQRFESFSVDMIILVHVDKAWMWHFTAIVMWIGRKKHLLTWKYYMLFLYFDHSKLQCLSNFHSTTLNL